jgi:hypothetical protein
LAFRNALAKAVADSGSASQTTKDVLLDNFEPSALNVFVKRFIAISRPIAPSPMNAIVLSRSEDPDVDKHLELRHTRLLADEIRRFTRSEEVVIWLEKREMR